MSIEQQYQNEIDALKKDNQDLRELEKMASDVAVVEIRKLCEENDQLRELLGEWRKRWFLGEGLTSELEQATLAALGEKVSGEAGYKPGTGSIIMSAPRVTPG